ncbi:hypothetical protein O181_009622 [Austropuccinia psidii MF-1]|uniref:Uncharacterized protein n=1 Tax=Austropuccinia psidii MF-1 TaxID=1389203 RepID=A0A9Q3BS48_9BASI|nr:hypothetical protein [Austropuccinia psidii MF-1]
MPCEQDLQKHTPGPSGTQWLEDLFRSNNQAITFLILTFELSEVTLIPFLETSRHNEPPIPGPYQASYSQFPSHESNSTCEPEPEVAPTQSMEETFACSPTPPSFINIDNKPIGAPLHFPAFCHSPLVASPEIPPIAPSPPVQSSPHSHDEAL